METKPSLKNIEKNKDLIIKEAEMGSAIVILNKTCYRRKIQKILHDETNDKSISRNIDAIIISKFTEFYTIHSDTFTKKGHPTELHSKNQ